MGDSAEPDSHLILPNAWKDFLILLKAAVSLFVMVF